MADAEKLAAFVTGAGSGIGRATAGRLARDGYWVGAFDLDPNGVEATVDAIVSSGGAMSERQVDGKMGSPCEVAAGIAFIASSDGRFINGSELVMEGGMTAR